MCINNICENLLNNKSYVYKIIWHIFHWDVHMLWYWERCYCKVTRPTGPNPNRMLPGCWFIHGIQIRVQPQGDIKHHLMPGMLLKQIHCNEIWFKSLPYHIKSKAVCLLSIAFPQQFKYTNFTKHYSYWSCKIASTWLFVLYQLW